jgi:hypothetical protein
MNCREFKTALVLRLLEPLPPEILREIDGHKAVCRKCAARFDKASRLPVFLPRQGEPAPSEPAPSWAALIDCLERGRTQRPRFFQLKIVWAVVGTAAVFLAGIVIGTGVFRPDRSAPGRAIFAPDNIVRAYVQRLDPFLVDFQIKGKSPAPEEVIEFEKRITMELRRDTALLKEAARLAGRSDLVAILDEIDILLVSLAYLQSGDREASDQMRRIIRENRHVWASHLLSFEKIL